MVLCISLCCTFSRCGVFLPLLIGGCGGSPGPLMVDGKPMCDGERPEIMPAKRIPGGGLAVAHVDPCATCRIRDHWCCDPWETRDEHEDTE